MDHDEDHNERIVDADVYMKDQNPQSPYGVICAVHDKQGLSNEQYKEQMLDPDSTWKCPVGGWTCTRVFWDDERYENAYWTYKEERPDAKEPEQD